MTPIRDPLAWLMTWYRSHCNGDWEHQNGVTIGTLDNPGWLMDVDLRDTEHEGRTLQRKLIERSDNDWVSIEVVNNKFHADGGPENLSEMISLFADFVGRLGE
jgi:hypothetical protein